MTKRHIQGLLDEPPISIYPSLAKRAGINKAAILQQVHFLAQMSERDESPHNYQDDRYWVYNTYADWRRKYFPWLSSATIKRLFLALEADGIMLSAPWKGDKSGQIKAYAINYDRWEQWLSDPGNPSQNDTGVVSKRDAHPYQNSTGVVSKRDGFIYKEEETPGDSKEETPNETPPPPESPGTPARDGDDAPNGGGGGEMDDAVLEMILREFDKAKVWKSTAQRAIGQLGKVKALALLYACESGANPGGLLATKLSAGAEPPEDFIDRAGRWIEQREFEITGERLANERLATVNVYSEVGDDPPGRESETPRDSDPPAPLPGERGAPVPASEPSAPVPPDEIPETVRLAWVAVRAQYEAGNGETWRYLGRCTLGGWDGTTARIDCPNGITAPWLRRRAQSSLDRLMTEFAGMAVRVEFAAQIEAVVHV